MSDARGLPIWKRLLFLLLPTLLLWVLLEGCLWLWSPPWLVFENHLPRIYERHQTWGYRYTPNAEDRYFRYQEIDHLVHIGPHGWRGEAPAKTKPPGEYRLLLLGDSHAAGLEVPEAATLASVLERTLRRSRPGLDVRVYSLGLDGSGTDVQRRIFEEEGLDMAPDLVVLQIFRNDFRDIGRPLVYREGVGEFVIAYQTEQEREALLAEAERRRRSWFRRLCRFSRIARAIRIPFEGETPSNFLTARTWFETREKWEPLPDRVQAVQEEIGRIRSLAEESGAPFALVSLPAIWILEKEPPADRPSYPISLLGDWLTGEGIPFLDLQPVLLESSEIPEELYFTLDSHPNPAGYAFYGESTSEWLLEGGLLPKM